MPRHQLASVLLLIVTHIIEVALFAIGMLLIIALDLGFIEGLAAPNFTDLMYFSLSVYSSLGFGDLLPTGNLRIYSGVEAIVGLLLIAWSATVLFGEVVLPKTRVGTSTSS
jgi:hypothetical protein